MMDTVEMVASTFERFQREWSLRVSRCIEFDDVDPELAYNMDSLAVGRSLPNMSNIDIERAIAIAVSFAVAGQLGTEFFEQGSSSIGMPNSVLCLPEADSYSKAAELIRSQAPKFLEQLYNGKSKIEVTIGFLVVGRGSSMFKGFRAFSGLAPFSDVVNLFSFDGITRFIVSSFPILTFCQYQNYILIEHVAGAELNGVMMTLEYKYLFSFFDGTLNWVPGDVIIINLTRLSGQR